MVTVNWEDITELIGEFKSLKDSSIISVDSLVLYPGSKRALADVLQRNQVTRDNQCLIIDELLIPKAGREQIEAGQFPIQQKGNTYTMTVDSRHPTRFSACLETLVSSKVDPTIHYACEVTLGSIDLDLSKCSMQSLEDGSVLYKKVPMTLYPVGKYSAKILE